MFLATTSKLFLINGAINFGGGDNAGDRQRTRWVAERRSGSQTKTRLLFCCHRNEEARWSGL